MTASVSGYDFREEWYPASFVEPGRFLTHLALLTYHCTFPHSTVLELELDNGMWQSLGRNVQEVLLDELGGTY
jgi:hypothetical protein